MCEAASGCDEQGYSLEMHDEAGSDADACPGSVGRETSVYLPDAKQNKQQLLDKVVTRLNYLRGSQGRFL